jgi:hypothetical protein
VANEKPEFELRRLRTEQEKTRQDEVFLGLLPAERAGYNRRRERIRRLEGEIQTIAIAEKTSQFAKAEQRHQWKEESETDTPQAVARQPYRNREKDSEDASRDSTKKRGKAKNESDERGSD